MINFINLVRCINDFADQDEGRVNLEGSIVYDIFPDLFDIAQDV